MFARKTRLALATLAVWTFTAGMTSAQEAEPKPQTEAEAEARFGVKTKPEPKPQTEPQVEHALSQRNFARGGWYLGFEGLVIMENSKYVGGPVGGPDKHILTGGFDFRMGNRHNRWLATEIQGTWVNSYKTIEYTNNPGEYENEFTIWGIWVNERVYLTKSRIQPFLTGGLGVIQLRTEFGGNLQPNPDSAASVASTWGFSALLGVGLEFYLTENFITTVGVNYYFTTGAIKDHDFLTAGIGFQFF